MGAVKETFCRFCDVCLKPFWDYDDVSLCPTCLILKVNDVPTN